MDSATTEDGEFDRHAHDHPFLEHHLADPEHGREIFREPARERSVGFPAVSMSSQHCS